MQTNKFFLNNLWRWKCGLPELKLNSKLNRGIDDLYESEWDFYFEKLMKNRLVMGAYRYGLLETKNPNYDNMGSLKRRADLYEKTGNLEHLVDIANLALVEFKTGNHPNKHFSSNDDVDEKVEIK